MSEPTKRLRIFKSHMAHMQYVFHGMHLDKTGQDGKPIPNGIGGKAAAFMSGEYRTDVAEEIAELENEIRLKHPFIHQDADPTKREMDAEDVDPMVALKKKHFAEFAAAQQAAMNPSKDMGKSDQSGGAGTGVGTTATHGAGAQQSDAVPGAVALTGTAAFLAGFKKAP